MRTFFEAAGANYYNKKTFVILSKDLADFPLIYICTYGKNPLRDNGRVLESMLKKYGVRTKSNFYPSLPHLPRIFPGIKGGEEFLADVVNVRG